MYFLWIRYGGDIKIYWISWNFNVLKFFSVCENFLKFIKPIGNTDDEVTSSKWCAIIYKYFWSGIYHFINSTCNTASHHNIDY